MSQFPQESIAALIDDYGLNLDGGQTDKIVAVWLQDYDSNWIVKAIVEAVYRGRYQVKSVDGILRQWQRLGQPRCHFKPDFERERLEKFSFVSNSQISEVLPQPLDPFIATPARLEPPSPIEAIQPTTRNEYLDPDELSPFQHHHLPVSTFSAPTRISLPKTRRDLMAEQELLTQPVTVDSLPTIMSNLAEQKATLRPRLQLLDTLKRAISEPLRSASAQSSQNSQNDSSIRFRSIYNEQILKSSV